MVGQRVFGLALGYEDLVDHDELRHDPIIAVLAGKLTARRRNCAPVAGKSTLNGLDENCGAGGWAMTPSGIRGVLNDAVSIYFRDPALASPFVSRWCIGYTLEPVAGAFRVRTDEPTPLIAAGLYRTP